MERRHFLKQSTFLSIGGLLLPSLLLAECRKETLFEDVHYDGTVLIIGAGAAGLYAAYVLKSRGIKYQILEAAPTYGGRLGQLTGFANYPIDTGAQWLHGKNNLFGDMIQQSGTKITLDDTDLTYWYNNQLVATVPQKIDVFEGDDLPDISYKEYAIQKGLDDSYNNIVENIAGDQGADASLLSVYYNNLEEENWNSGDDDFKFEATYFDFLDKQVASHVKDNIQLNTPIAKIDSTQSTIVVTDTNGGTYTADKVIITVPISILKLGEIEFIPALPAEKTTAFSKIGMGAGMKVFLKFTNTFFDQNIVGGAICAAYADEQIGKSVNDHVLLAFIMGEQAEYLTSLGNDAAITTALLQELDTMYNGQATAAFVSSHVENWTTHPYIKGAYSYSTVGMGNARTVAAQSIDDKLFFAGEAMNLNGHHQTVFGAAESGYREVINILKSIKK